MFSRVFSLGFWVLEKSGIIFRKKRYRREGISNNNEWENWFRTPFLAHHKPKYIGPISANAGVP